jgi:hypothetical protein
VCLLRGTEWVFKSNLDKFFFFKAFTNRLYVDSNHTQKCTAILALAFNSCGYVNKFIITAIFRISKP